MDEFNCIQYLNQAVSCWENVSVGSYRYGGSEYMLGTREIGHVHPDGRVDVTLPKGIKDQLVQEGRAQPHYIHPDSAMVSFHMHSRGDVHYALWLLRLGYIQQLIRQFQHHPAELMRDQIHRQIEELNISPSLRAVFDDLIQEAVKDDPIENIGHRKTPRRTFTQL